MRTYGSPTPPPKHATCHAHPIPWSDHQKYRLWCPPCQTCPCSHGMARTQVADEGNATTLHKQWTADKGWSSSLSAGQGENNFIAKKNQRVTKSHEGSQTWPGFSNYVYTRFVQWKTGKVVLKIACTTDVINNVLMNSRARAPLALCHTWPSDCQNSKTQTPYAAW
jgi:hypothetical protein